MLVELSIAKMMSAGRTVMMSIAVALLIAQFSVTVRPAAPSPAPPPLPPFAPPAPPFPPAFGTCTTDVGTLEGGGGGPIIGSAPPLPPPPFVAGAGGAPPLGRVRSALSDCEAQPISPLASKQHSSS